MFHPKTWRIYDIFGPKISIAPSCLALQWSEAWLPSAPQWVAPSQGSSPGRHLTRLEFYHFPKKYDAAIWSIPKINISNTLVPSCGWILANVGEFQVVSPCFTPNWHTGSPSGSSDCLRRSCRWLPRFSCWISCAFSSRQPVRHSEIWATALLAVGTSWRKIQGFYLTNMGKTWENPVINQRTEGVQPWNHRNVKQREDNR